MTSCETAVAAAAQAAPETKPAFGVWSPVLTPVDSDYRPDMARFVAHARWLLDNGCHGLGVFGTTGEANSFLRRGARGCADGRGRGAAGGPHHGRHGLLRL